VGRTRRTGPATVKLAPGDAAARGIADGALVRLYNDRGACFGRAALDDTLRPGIAVMETGAWFAPGPDGIETNGNPNVLTADRRTSRLAQASAAQSALVRVEPAAARDFPPTSSSEKETA
jgi:biotin/methionine sulfoxide reductase